VTDLFSATATAGQVSALYAELRRAA
jgi:hypothetical protein